MGKEELEQCARSFHFEECVQRDGLTKILQEHAKNRKGEGEWEEAPVPTEEEKAKLSG